MVYMVDGAILDELAFFGEGGCPTDLTASSVVL